MGWIPVDVFRKRQAVSVLKRGVPLAGTVADGDGRPLASAHVVLGFAAGLIEDPPSATTDAAGR